MGNARSAPAPSARPSARPSTRPAAIVSAGAAGCILRVPRPELDALRDLTKAHAIDEHLSESQFAALAAALGLSDALTQSALFRLLDTDKTGSVSYAELASAYAVLRAGQQDERIWLVFHMADESSAGTLTRSQVRVTVDTLASPDDPLVPERALQQWACAALPWGGGHFTYDTFHGLVTSDAPGVLLWLDTVGTALHAGVAARVRHAEKRRLMDMEVESAGNGGFSNRGSNLSVVMSDVNEKGAAAPLDYCPSDLGSLVSHGSGVVFAGDNDDFGDSEDGSSDGGDGHAAHGDILRHGDGSDDSGLLPKALLRAPAVDAGAPDLTRLVRRTARGGGASPFVIDYGALRFERVIGEGAFAQVWRGEWLRSPVAIKKFRLDEDAHSEPATSAAAPDASRLSRAESMSVLREFATSASRAKYDAFLREVRLMSVLRHPNLMLYMGACGDERGTPLCIVSELLEGGSLHDFLHAAAAPRVAPRAAIDIALGVARGMHYLHSSVPTIFHRDLKSRNVLLREPRRKDAPPDAPAPHVVICDFGLCSLFGEERGREVPVGTAAYMAPDVLAGARFEAADDVYSYGVLLWEIFVGQVPYKGMQGIQVMYAVSCEDLRPPIEPEFKVDPAVENLIQRCWATEREERPTFGEVISILLEIKDALFGDGSEQ